MSYFKRLSWVFFLNIFLTSFSFADECKVDAQMKSKAHDYMKQSGLIVDGEEFLLETLKMESRWTHVRSLKYNDVCLHVMEVCFKSEGEEADCEHSSSGSYEVIASKDGVFLPFEAAVSVPSSVIASIGHLKGSDPLDDRYYVQFAGTAAVAALKSVYAQVPVCGFSGKIDPTEKASYDPTQSRKWSITDPLFNLRRGLSAEAYDVRPSYLDKDLKGFYQACNGNVAPWSLCFVRQLQDDHSQWLDVKYAPF
ncbi:MAG: hypothetical protein ABIQ95_06935 [Bdellovibrionia bacterium]